MQRFHLDVVFHSKAGLRPPPHMASLPCLCPSLYTAGLCIYPYVVISRPTPLILRRRLRCPDGKRASQLYALSGLLRKLAHNKLSVNTVIVKKALRC